MRLPAITAASGAGGRTLPAAVADGRCALDNAAGRVGLHAHADAWVPVVQVNGRGRDTDEGETQTRARQGSAPLLDANLLRPGRAGTGRSPVKPCVTALPTPGFPLARALNSVASPEKAIMLHCQSDGGVALASPC